MKYLLLLLLLVVVMAAIGQTKKTKHTNEYRELSGKIDFLLNELINERVLASKNFDSLRNDDNMIKDQAQRDFIDIMQLGERYWDLKRSFDSLRKEVDSFKMLLWPSIHDSGILGIKPYSWTTPCTRFTSGDIVWTMDSAGFWSGRNRGRIMLDNLPTDWLFGQKISDLYLQEEHLDLTPDTISITTVSGGTQHMKRFDKIKKVWVDVPILKRRHNRKHIDTATIKVRLGTAFKNNGGGLIYYRLNKLDPAPSDTIWMGCVMFDGNVCRPITGLYRGHEVVTPEIFDYMIWEKKTGRLLPIDSNGTYHDHMPTQLTVKKRHKHHKWVKKSPPPTKDSGEKTVR